jgi:hypothetical protein
MYLKMIFLLWLLPAALGATVAFRWMSGTPLITAREQRFIFHDDAETELTPWLVIKLATLAMLLFAVGLGLGLVIVNLGSPWTALAPLGTALATMLLLACWLRAAPEKKPLPRRSPTEQNHARGERVDAVDF